MEYLSYYTTLERVLNELDRVNPNNSANDPIQQGYEDFVDFMEHAIPQWSQYIMMTVGASFAPYKDEKTYYIADLVRNNRIENVLWGGWQWRLPEPLIVLNSITWDGNLLSASDFITHPNNKLPIRAIEFNPDSANVSLDTAWGKSVVINGTWGYANSLSDTYLPVSADSSVTINSSATTLTVVASSAYETYQYIRIESELMLITAKPTSTTLTVQRGVLGTDAVGHTAQQVETLRIYPIAQTAVTRLCAWAYQSRSNVSNAVQVGDVTLNLSEQPTYVRKLITQLFQINAQVRIV